MTVYIKNVSGFIYKKEISNPVGREEFHAVRARLTKKYHDWDMDLYALKKRTKKWAIHYIKKMH